MMKPIRVILVAAPDAPMQALLGRLREAGADAVAWPSASAALRDLEDRPPSAAVLDASIPSVDLLRVYSALRAGADGSPLPIVFTNQGEAGADGDESSPTVHLGVGVGPDDVMRVLQRRVPGLNGRSDSEVAATTEVRPTAGDVPEAVGDNAAGAAARVESAAPAAQPPDNAADDTEADAARSVRVVEVSPEPVPSESVAAASVEAPEETRRPVASTDVSVADVGEQARDDRPEARPVSADALAEPGTADALVDVGTRRPARWPAELGGDDGRSVESSDLDDRRGVNRPRARVAEDVDRAPAASTVSARELEDDWAASRGGPPPEPVYAEQPRPDIPLDRRIETVGVDRAAVRSILDAVIRRWWLALLVLASVLAATAYYTATRTPTYLARSTLVVSPSAQVEPGSLVYSIDSLGRGRVVGTYAEVLGSEVVYREALQRLGLGPDALNRYVVFRTSTISDTAVIQVTAESADPQFSADSANLVGEVGIERMAQLYPVYNLVFLTRAIPPTTVYRPDPVRNYSLGLLLGLILAIVLSYLFDVVARALQRDTEPLDEDRADVYADADRGPEPRLRAAEPSTR